jgi:hypothetical protein
MSEIDDNEVVVAVANSITLTLLLYSGVLIRS